ncbi:MAG TPA: hypothetical protein VM265_05925 [Sphingomicrobium sp.]|nr:hypothetical protein [Sphingomicrobium sp.]
MVAGGETLQATTIREAADKIMEALRTVARQVGHSVPNETERLFSEGRGRLLMDKRAMSLLPASLARNQSAGRLVAAISKGPDDRVPAVEEFNATLEETLRRLELQGTSATAPAGDGDALLDEDGEPLLDQTGEVITDGTGSSGFGVGAFGAGPYGGGAVHHLEAEGITTGSPEISPASLRVHDAISASSASEVDVRAGAGTAVGFGTARGAGEPVIDASRWTGTPSRATRLIALRTEIGAARDAVGYLIDDLTSPEGNGGPLSEAHAEALEALRDLHRTLGEILHAVDRGRMDDDLGDSFAADIARCAADCLASLRDNSARATIALMTFAALSACGLPGFGGLVASGVLAVPKGARNKTGQHERDCQTDL